MLEQVHPEELPILVLSETTFNAYSRTLVNNLLNASTEAMIVDTDDLKSERLWQFLVITLK